MWKKIDDYVMQPTEEKRVNLEKEFNLTVKYENRSKLPYLHLITVSKGKKIFLEKVYNENKKTNY